MNCKQASKLISKSVDGFVSPDERLHLEQHLSTCQRCSEAYSDLVYVDSLLSRALPLQATLGDGFAAQVVGNLPVRRNRLTILKEAFLMSRFKYAVPIVVIMIVALGCLLMPHSKDNQALAAMMSAMSKVKSLHFKYEYLTHERQHSDPEVWVTPKAMKSVNGTGWIVCKNNTLYNYHTKDKYLIVTPLPSTDTRKIFAMLVDPRVIAGIARNASVNITTKDLKYDGKPMRQIEVEQVPSEPSKQYKRLLNKVTEIVAQQISHRGQDGERRRLMTMHAPRTKLVYLVDPKTNLAKNVNIYQYRESDRGWTHLLRVAKIDYNIHLGNSFFSTNTPSGTKVHDLRLHK